MLLKQILATPALTTLRYRDFRILGVATVLAAFSRSGVTLVVGWLVLDLTDSPFMVGVALGIQMLPTGLFGILAGTAADTVDRARLVRLMSLGVAIPAGILGVLIAVDAVAVWHVLVLAFVFGCLQVFAQPARMSFAYDLVGPAIAVQGIAMISMAGRIGIVMGSVATGSIIARLNLEMACFVTVGSSVLAAFILLFVRSPGQAAPKATNSPRETLKNFFGEIQGNRVLLTLTASTAITEILGLSHQVLLPSLARDILRVGAEGLGVMGGVGSLGGILGIALVSSVERYRRRGLVYIAGIFMLGSSVATLGIAPGFFTVLILLAMIHSMIALTDILSQTLMQLSVPNELRGSAMGSWMQAVGIGPLGSLEIGAIASFATISLALAINGLGLMGLVVMLTVLVPRIRRI